MNLFRYTRIPFEDGGRSFDGVDCWGLVWLVFREELGIKLPEYAEISCSELMSIAREIRINTNFTPTNIVHTGPWNPIARQEELSAFDVIAMTALGKSKRYPCHVGIMVDRNSILHTEQGVGVTCEPISSPFITPRIYAMRRYSDA